MYRSLFKCPVVSKFSDNASLCPKKDKKQGLLLFRLLGLTMINIKYKGFSCK